MDVKSAASLVYGTTGAFTHPICRYIDRKSKQFQPSIRGPPSCGTSSRRSSRRHRRLVRRRRSPTCLPTTWQRAAQVSPSTTVRSTSICNLQAPRGTSEQRLEPLGAPDASPVDRAPPRRDASVGRWRIRFPRSRLFEPAAGNRVGRHRHRLSFLQRTRCARIVNAGDSVIKLLKRQSQVASAFRRKSEGCSARPRPLRDARGLRRGRNAHATSAEP